MNGFAEPRWRRVYRRPSRGIPLNMSGPSQPSGILAKRVLAVLLGLAITVVAVVQYRTGRGPVAVAWLAVGPLLASLLLRPWVTAALAGWATLLGVGLIVNQPARPGTLVSHLGVCVLLAAFAVANAALRTAAQRRLSRVRAVARVAQSALLREVPATVTAGRMASRYLSAAAEARVGGDILEVVSEGGRTRWLIGDTRGKGLPAVRLASIATTSFRDACAQPGLSLAEVARVVDRSSDAGRGRGGLRDGVVRGVRSAWLARARHLRSPAAAAAELRRRAAGSDPERLRHTAGPASRHDDVHVLGGRG